MNPPPLSLYLHFPWCVKKCPYCDFNSHPLRQNLPQDQYIDALVADLDFELAEIEINTPLISIFMGGGTPSLFVPDSMARLLNALKQRLRFSDDIEITMEANPGTTEHHDFSQYRQAGINRLSIGAQSFDAAQLKSLGRIHSSQDVFQAFESARAGGFDNINIDLMFGLENQTIDAASKDVSTALQMSPEHISLYQLTLEPNTVFYRYPPKLPSHDYIVEMQQQLQQQLAQRKYHQYEVSAYAKSGKQSRHNLNYWQFGDYLGIGAGAHGKITNNKCVTRRARIKHPATFIKQVATPRAIAENKIVPRQEILFEYLMNALRLKGGFDINQAMNRTGLDQHQINDPLDQFFNNGLIVKHGQCVFCSDQGYLFLDHILQSLV